MPGSQLITNFILIIIFQNDQNDNSIDLTSHEYTSETVDTWKFPIIEYHIAD